MACKVIATLSCIIDIPPVVKLTHRFVGRTFLKKQNKKVHHRMNQKEKVNGDGSKEQNQETFWRDSKTLKMMC